MKNTFLFLFCSLSAFSCSLDINTFLSSIDSYEQIKVNQLKQQQLQQQVETLESSYLPKLYFSGDYRSSSKNTALLGAEQLLFDGGKLDSSINSKKSVQTQLSYEELEEKKQLKLDMLSNIENFHKSQLKIKELESTLSWFENFQSNIDRRILAGVAPTSDKELFLSRKNSLLEELSYTKEELESYKNKILFVFDKNFCDISIPGLPFHDFSFFSMLDNNPSMKKIYFEKEQKNFDLLSSQREYYPDLKLKAETKRSGSVYTDYTQDNQQAIFLELSAKFGFDTSHKIEEKRLSILESSTKEIQIKKEQMLAYLNAFNYQKSLLERKPLLESIIISNQSVLDSYIRLYLVGKRSWLDVVNMNREIMQSKIDLHSLNSELLLSNYKLQILKGDSI